MLRAFADGQLFGAVRGDGPPRVLALHGWARSHRDFDAVLEPEGADALPSVALDLPGFGASPPPTEAWGGAAYAEAVAPVLSDMGRPVVVLGHSFGGRVAVHLAAARPEAVHALVLTGVPLLHPQGRRRRVAPAFRALRRLHRMGLVSARAMEAGRQRYGSADYRAAQGVMRQVHVRAVNETYEAQLAAVQCPVYLVWGADDTAAPLEMAVRAEAMLAHAQLVSYPGVGHLTPLVIPGPLHDAVRACLS